MRNKFFIGLFAILFLCGLTVLGSSPKFFSKVLESVKTSPISSVFFAESENESKKETSKNENRRVKSDASLASNQSLNSDIPEYILYDRMFSLIPMFKKLAEEQAARGEPVTAFHGYFEREANLDDGQAGILQETAAGYVGAVKLIDTEAEILIEQLRAQHKTGTSSEEPLIQPSPELLKLQEQRNNLALQYRDQLSSLLGTAKFNELDSFVKGTFAAGFQAMPLPLASVPTHTDQGEGK